MSGDHLERLEATLAELERTPRLAALARLAGGSYDERRAFAGLVRRHVDPAEFRSDLRAALDELKQLRAERRSEFRLLLAELEAAKAEARDLQAYMLLVVQRYGYDGKLTFHEGDLRRAQQWLDSLAAEAAPQQPARDGECAWHTLHYGIMPDPFGPEPESFGYQLDHPEQCATLPPGAVCWATHEPYQHWWPTQEGTYRIRPVQWLTGSGPDGDEPNVHQSMEIQARAGDDWVDYHGPSLGSEPEAIDGD